MRTKEEEKTYKDQLMQGYYGMEKREKASVAAVQSLRSEMELQSAWGQACRAMCEVSREYYSLYPDGEEKPLKAVRHERDMNRSAF